MNVNQNSIKIQFSKILRPVLTWMSSWVISTIIVLHRLKVKNTECGFGWSNIFLNCVCREEQTTDTAGVVSGVRETFNKQQRVQSEE